MELTFVGIILIVVGTYVVLLGSVRTAIVFLVVSALFDGSAAISLPSLGGSSIPPVQFALLFTTLRILAPKGGYLGLLPTAIIENKWIVLFAIYGIASAYLAPRMFAGAIDVFPMHADRRLGLYGTVPLRPTAQNLTAGFYMVGALLLAISSYIFCRIPRGGKTLANVLMIACWIHIVTGLSDLALRGTPFEEVLSVFRNGGYVLLDHSASGFVRIRGVLPEASTYAGIGFALFVANMELWYRSIQTRATGLAAAVMALVLVISTSSTAYVALLVYGVFFVLRGILFPTVAPPGKILLAAYSAAGIFFLVCILMAVVPELPFAVYELVVDMTVGKPTSDSGQQRLFWAMQGWDGFLVSYGLGIGAGSFRSSSIFMAILGSMGFVGVITFATYLVTVFQGSRRSTWGLGPTELQSIGGALGTAALLSLVPAGISSPHAVPSDLFSIMAGAAIALRSSAAEGLARPSKGERQFSWKEATPREETSAA
ncbi:glycoside hydrolase [Altererythrobacter arenosus]|uniref:Glycoside hydrolase n=1 Tax=Altererythrobacter arenosus TaxID=3032592 RepID=A0ABY8FLQ2_9SPHN|nr:glycoside hydrolase [Altererythrobacter sp. CAU 1644]WFL75958.1 glycoside hydrolase [Altererythrobacter sp. CAU 1644]